MADNNKNEHSGDNGFGDWVNNNGTLIGFLLGAAFVVALIINAIGSLF